MGASGDILIVTRADWDTNCPGVTPDQVGLYHGNIIGVDAVWSYDGDNLPFDDGDNRSDFMAFTATPDEKTRCQNALTWFDYNCERHELWT